MLTLSCTKAECYAWAVIPAPKDGWDLARRATVTAEIANTGDIPVGLMFWVVGDHGWSAVIDSAALAPQETLTFSCNLRPTYPDGTPKLNHGDVKQVQVMLTEAVGAKGKGAVCLGMPFLDRATNRIVENAWGNADDTADYLMRLVTEVCD